jgi:thiol:disulfide interchange protein DsbD
MSSAEPESPRPPEAEGTRPRSGSQSKLSSTLLLVLAAAALFRVVTTVMDKPGGHSAGLVRWTEPQAAVQTARTSGKPILYDFTAEWCAPCRMLDSDGWGDAKIAALVNGSYVPARVVDRAREEGRNPAWMDELQRRYRVGAFPTLVVATADGREVAVAQGYAGKERLMEFLEGSRVKAAAPPSTP